MRWQLPGIIWRSEKHDQNILHKKFGIKKNIWIVRAIPSPVRLEAGYLIHLKILSLRKCKPKGNIHINIIVDNIKHYKLWGNWKYTVVPLQKFLRGHVLTKVHSFNKWWFINEPVSFWCLWLCLTERMYHQEKDKVEIKVISPENRTLPMNAFFSYISLLIQPRFIEQAVCAKTHIRLKI